MDKERVDLLLLYLNQKMNYRIGIDIGGTNTLVGLVSQNGEIIQQTSILTRTHSGFADYILTLARAIKRLNIKDKSILGVGVGAPNGNAYNGTIDCAPNMPWEGVLQLQKMLFDALKYPIFVTNDANAAAMGEKMYGGAKEMDDFIVVTLGTGVGSGIYANGELIHGHGAFAGEIGHVITIPDGRMCACGRKGCVEAYASAQGVVKTFFELQTENLTQPKAEITTKLIYELALKGNQCAIQTFDETARILGLTLANSIAHTDPEAIFLFGGLANAGDFLLNPLKKYIDGFVLHNYKGKVKILRSQLKSSDAAILGAAALVKQ